jgi:hypothetical protein
VLAEVMNCGIDKTQYTGMSLWYNLIVGKMLPYRHTAVLYCVIQYTSVLCCVIQYNAVLCCVIQYTAVLCCVIQCTAVLCCVIQQFITSANTTCKLPEDG